jgi:hypothetical protein
MSTSERQPLPAMAHRVTAPLRDRLRSVVADRVDEILAEVPQTLRRLQTLLLVLALSVPVFLAGAVAALWRFVH